MSTDGDPVWASGDNLGVVYSLFLALVLGPGEPPPEARDFRSRLSSLSALG